MSLHELLLQRAAEGRPVRVALMGSGAVPRAFLAQARRVPGLQVMCLAGSTVEKAREAVLAAGWPKEAVSPTSAAKAVATGGIWITDDAETAVNAGGVEVVVEAGTSAALGVRRALAAFRRSRPVVMANLAADALAGPLLARRAVQSGTLYSLATGTAPAALTEQVDRARACGLSLISAGRLLARAPEPQFMPDAEHDADAVAVRDGSQVAVELASLANAAKLLPPADGPRFAPCGLDDLAACMVPESRGGGLAGPEMLDALCSPEGGEPFDGTFIISEGGGTPPTALYRPMPLAGVELTLSVASVALRREGTGMPRVFAADVICIAKKGLDRDQVLDGEGGACVRGKLIPAADALAADYLPLGLAAGAKLKTHIAVGHPIRWFDVDVDPGETRADVVSFRREMEWLLAGRTE